MTPAPSNTPYLAPIPLDKIAQVSDVHDSS